MNGLSANDAIKLAQNNAGFREKLIAEISKVASGDEKEKDPSQFNEKVPATEGNGEDEEKSKAAPQQTPPAAVPAEEPAAVPVEEEPVGDTPEAVGARAAQAFIGAGVMDAAMQGDTNAIDLISRTAGQVAGSVAEANAKAVAGSPTTAVPATGEEAAMEGATGAEAVPAAGGMPAAPVANPTDELATEIAGAPAGAPAPGGMPTKADQTQVAPQAPQGAQPVNGQPAPAQGGELSDEAALKKLIQMAKSGKI